MHCNIKQKRDITWPKGEDPQQKKPCLLLSAQKMIKGACKLKTPITNHDIQHLCGNNVLYWLDEAQYASHVQREFCLYEHTPTREQKQAKLGELDINNTMYHTNKKKRQIRKKKKINNL